MIGNCEGYKECVVKGKMQKGTFLAYYINDKDQIVAVAGLGKGKEILALHQAMQQNRMPKGSDIKSGRVKMRDIKGTLKQNPGAGKCKRAGCCRKKRVLP